jgi:hypothetical protein
MNIRAVLAGLFWLTCWVSLADDTYGETRTTNGKASLSESSVKVVARWRNLDLVGVRKVKLA